MPRIPRAKIDRFWPLLLNAVRLRCPACKRGPIFPRLLKMAPGCPACGLSLERESGYFLGSIYFNYAVTCMLAGALYFGLRFGADAPGWAATAAATAAAVLFPFWFWRYARSFWLMFDQYFDPRRPPGEPTSSGSR
jgi:uncharacterized protein (DUF983 family)